MERKQGYFGEQGGCASVRAMETDGLSSQWTVGEGIKGSVHPRGRKQGEIERPPGRFSIGFLPQAAGGWWEFPSLSSHFSATWLQCDERWHMSKRLEEAWENSHFARASQW